MEGWRPESLYWGFPGMMLQSLRGMGQTPADMAAVQQTTVAPTGQHLSTPMGSADCQLCLAHPWAAIFSPSCWAETDLFGGGCTLPSIPQAYLQGAAQAPPPTQDQINAQTPDETVNQILADSQAAAVAAATAAAANEAAANDAATNAGNTTNWVLIAAAGVAVLFLMNR